MSDYGDQEEEPEAFVEVPAALGTPVCSEDTENDGGDGERESEEGLKGRERARVSACEG